MAAKCTRKPHNLLPKFNFQFSMTSSLLLSTHLVSTHPYHYWHLFITSYFNLLDKSSTVVEMGDRDHNRHGPKRGGLLCPFRGEGELGPRLTQCGLGRGLLPYQVTSSSIQPFGHNRHGPKTGGRCLFLGGGELRPHLTQRRLGRGLPPYQVTS